MKKRILQRHSIFTRMLLPMLLVLVIQSGIFMAIVTGSGAIQNFNDNILDIFNSQVSTRKNYVENELVKGFADISSYLETINTDIEDFLQEQGYTLEQLSGNDIATQALESVYKHIIYMLHNQSVTGAFIVLNPAASANEFAQQQQISCPGLYLRDLDPSFNPIDHSDFLVECAPLTITKKMQIPMDTAWQPQLVFSPHSNSRNSDFVYQPLKAVEEYPHLSAIDLGYWSLPFHLNEDNVEIMTYSVPLVSKDGTSYGVLGIEFTTDYLKKLLHYDEIVAHKKGTYLLAVDLTGNDGQFSFEQAFYNGPIFQQLFGSQEQINFIPDTANNNTFTADSPHTNSKVYGNIQYLKLYNSNTPFENQKWALIGVAKSEDLLKLSNQIMTALVAALFISLACGCISIYIISRHFTKPISALVQDVKNSNPMLPVKFKKVKVLEIDELANAVEKLSADILDSASKLSQIIEMTSTSIAAFEYQKNSSTVFYTHHFFTLLGIDHITADNALMDEKTFWKHIKRLKSYLENDITGLEQEENVKIYKIPGKNKYSTWVRMKIIEDEDRILGVVEDVTSDMIEKKKIEYERDYDLLTNLLNRRAFYSLLQEKFSQNESLQTGALIMFDLDNLKYINDTYGHDYGDQYIHCTANILKKCVPQHCLLSRMSGDEFYIFIYGYEDKAAIRKIIDNISHTMKTTAFPLPDHRPFRVRASTGIAWYPDDSDSYEQLIKYADFAMYKVKNTTKGQIQEFDLPSYEKDSYLLHNKEDLNKFIEDEMVEYYFQPIVDTSTAEVFAYEALMRSKLPALKTPVEILSLARSQSKLYEIERLTLFNSIKCFLRHTYIPAECKLFINSIADQTLSPNDITELEQLYLPHLHRIVIEVTEEEKLDNVYARVKKECSKRWGASIALDDFGSGYNGEAVLLSLMPNYVKIDMSIVRNIDTDKNRQSLLRNLISYCKERNIRTIAEGVETREEMETLIASGINYLQGYYLGKAKTPPVDISIAIKKEILQIYNHSHPTK